jgi:hypothetical protein
LSSGTVLFFENFHGRLAFEDCEHVNGFSGHGRFFAVHASGHILMFGASLANGFATWCDVIAQSGCLSYGSLLADQRRQSAIRHRFVNCPSFGGQRNTICLPSGLMRRLRSMRIDCVNQRPSMARGLSCGSREVTAFFVRLPSRGRMAANNVHWRARRGISDATGKHLARF